MTLVELIGWCATCVGALLGLPQLIRLLRTRRLEGLSLPAWRAILVLNIVWLAHGLHIAQPPQVVTNSIALCTTVPLLVLLSRSLGRSLPKALAPSLLAAAVIIAVDLQLGSLAFGIVAIIPGVFSNAGQSLAIIRSRQVNGVAPLFLLLACLNQCLWLTWALLVHDPGTIAASGLTLALTAFNLTWFTLRRLGLPAMFVGDSGDLTAPAAQPELARV